MSRQAGNCCFVSDLHGRIERYEALFQTIRDETPGALFLGGDLLPHAMARLAGGSAIDPLDFIDEFLAPGLADLKCSLGELYPEVFIILGNDDLKLAEASVLSWALKGLWTYAHRTRASFGRFRVYGYSYVPPTPFRLKDWERYDVSRYIDPGCVSPEEGRRSVPIDPRVARYATIDQDLRELAGEDSMESAIFLFHTPPYGTKLDRAALDGKMIDHVPLDVHVGSIAVQRFIEHRQPLLTLHGHVHESRRLTGSWRDRAGRTHMLSAAHDGPELALVRFNLGDLDNATLELK